MTLPTLHVYMAFGDDPLETAPTWTEVTDLLDPVPVRIRSGRNDEWSPYQPATVMLPFDGSGRVLDPTNTAGSFYPNLKPWTQVKITGEVASVEYERFCGWAKMFPQVVAGSTPMSTSVVVECVGRLGWAARTSLPEDLFGDVVAGFGDPLVWLRDIEGGRWKDVAGSGNGVVLVQRLTADATTGTPRDAVATSSPLLPGLTSSGLDLDGETWGELANPISVADGDPWTVASVLKTTDTSRSLAGRSHRGVPPGWTLSPINYGYQNTDIGIDATGHLYWVAENNDATYYFRRITSSIAVNDGRAHLLVVKSDGAGVSLWIDGVEDTAATTDTVNDGPGVDTTGTSAWFLELQRLFIPGDTWGALGYQWQMDTSTPILSGSCQEFYVADFEWSDAQVLYAAQVAAAFLEETADERAARLLDLVGFPSAWRALSTDCRALVGQLTGSGQSLLAALREIERSEQGRLYESPDGLLTLAQRYRHQEVTAGTTVQATFSDDGSDFGYEQWAYREDPLDVRNDVTVTTPAGRRRSQDASSIAQYARQAETVATILASLERAQEMADGLVFWWKSSLSRFDPFQVDTVGLADADWVTLFGLRFGDRIQVEGTPQNVGTAVVKELLLDSMEEVITPGSSWTVTISGTPVPPEFFVIGSSELGTGVIGF